MEPIPGINQSLCDIRTSKFFSFHVEAEDFAPISYVVDAAPKVWYLIAPKHRYAFQELVSADVYSTDFLNDFGSGVKQFTSMKITALYSVLLLEKNASINITSSVQPRSQFVIFATRAYHTRFNTKCNVAKATNFADFWYRARSCRI